MNNSNPKRWTSITWVAFPYCESLVEIKADICILDFVGPVPKAKHVWWSHLPKGSMQIQQSNLKWYQIITCCMLCKNSLSQRGIIGIGCSAACANNDTDVIKYIEKETIFARWSIWITKNPDLPLTSSNHTIPHHIHPSPHPTWSPRDAKVFPRAARQSARAKRASSTFGTTPARYPSLMDIYSCVWEGSHLCWLYLKWLQSWKRMRNTAMLEMKSDSPNTAKSRQVTWCGYPNTSSSGSPVLCWLWFLSCLTISDLAPPTIFRAIQPSSSTFSFLSAEQAKPNLCSSISFEGMACSQVWNYVAQTGQQNKTYNNQEQAVQKPHKLSLIMVNLYIFTDVYSMQHLSGFSQNCLTYSIIDLESYYILTPVEPGDSGLFSGLPNWPAAYKDSQTHLLS